MVNSLLYLTIIIIIVIDCPSQARVSETGSGGKKMVKHDGNINVLLAIANNETAIISPQTSQLVRVHHALQCVQG